MRKSRGLLLALLGAAIFAAALCVGGVRLSWHELWSSAGSAREIFFQLRLPRVLMAAAVGSLLAVSGTSLQALLRNPLADPYLLGVSSGAALGAGIGVLLGSAHPAPLACLGAALSLGAVLLFSRSRGLAQPTRLILAGASLHSFTASVLTFLLSQARVQQSTSILFWLLGNLEALPYKTLTPFLILTGVVLAVFVFVAPSLDLLAQGEESARSLGLNVFRYQWGILFLSALATGLAVTFNGIIPFVGLITPHLGRLLFGFSHRRSLPAAAVLGALLVVGADALGRTVLAPQEIPVGVVTALVGAPFFLFILVRERGDRL